MNDGYKEVQFGPKTIEAPENWEVNKLGNICKKVTDGTHETPPTQESGYPFITARHITSGKIDFESCLYLEKEDHIKNINRCKPERGDILFTHIGTIGEVVKVETNKEFSIKNIALLKPKEKTCSEFLKYILEGRIVQGFIKRVTQGGVQNYLGLNTISSIRIPIPPLPKQRRIAEILSTVDDAIQKTDEVIEKAERLKKGLMQDLLTKGIGHDEFKEVQIGPETVEIPDIWDVKKLKNISDVRASNVNKKSKEEEKPVKLCNYLDVYNNEYIENDMDFMEATAKNREIERFTIEKDDVIITKDSETPDDIAVPAVVIDDLENVLCGYHLTLLKPDKNKINGIFLSKVLQSSPIKNEFCRLAQGLTRYGLNVPSIENALIFVPPLDEQIRIVKILEKIDQKIRTEERVKRNLKELKKGLMQDLLTGKVRVNI